MSRKARPIYKVCIGRVLEKYGSMRIAGEKNYLTRQGVHYYCSKAKAGDIHWRSDMDGFPYTFCYEDQLGRFVYAEAI